MFLKFLKNYFLKRKLKNNQSEVVNSFPGPIVSVGIALDQSYFLDLKGLVQSLLANGIKEDDISLLIYKDSIKKSDVFEHPSYSLKDIGWDGALPISAAQFAKREFDMLISYYDVEKPALMFLTQQSCAHFKVGFSSINKRLNHFMITTVAEQYQLFTTELFRYLKILNKL